MKAGSVFSIVMLAAAALAVFLMLKKPAPLADSQTPSALKANARSFRQKMESFRVKRTVRHSFGER